MKRTKALPQLLRRRQQKTRIGEIQDWIVFNDLYMNLLNIFKPTSNLSGT